MQLLDAIPVAVLKTIRGVVTDVDDTLTTRGILTAQAYSALEALEMAGLMIIAATGRPAGWCDQMARTWPVDAVIGENGAFYMRREPETGKFVQRFVVGDAQRQRDRERWPAIADKVLQVVPGARVAHGQQYHEADLAIDHAEDVSPLSPAEVARIVAIMQAEGMTATASSIHVNGWFGVYDKLSTTKLLLGEVFDCDLDAEREHFLYIGDSPNDAAMFDYFAYSVGVANVCDFADRMKIWPKYVTRGSYGAGFVELAARLMAARR
jgi:HAD superfamily hydrolase (TIGR01484 family)